MSNTEPTLYIVVFGLLILLVLFLIFREIVCWYWKINDQLGLLREIRDHMRLLTKDLQPELAVAGEARISPTDPDAAQCEGCQENWDKAEMRMFRGQYLCPECRKKAYQ